MNNSERLNQLYKKYELTKDDYFKHKFYTIITRSGIDKIQAKENIKIEYDICKASEDNKYIIIQAFASHGDRTIQTFGESSPSNTTNSYPVAMAEKRAMSRAVLKLAGFYELGAFGEDESDEFDKNKKPFLTKKHRDYEKLVNDLKQGTHRTGELLSGYEMSDELREELEEVANG